MPADISSARRQKQQAVTAADPKGTSMSDPTTSSLPGTMEHLDPNTVDIGENVRDAVDLNKDFMDSLRECRFSDCMADGDASTCTFAQFSSKWRTHFSHLRGGS
jgi:hypothetical protein